MMGGCQEKRKIRRKGRVVEERGNEMKRLKKQISMMTLLFFMCCVVLPIGPATPAEAMEGTTLTDAQIEGAIAWALNNKRATQANGDALTCMQFVYAAYQSVGINIGKYGSFGSSMIAYEQIRSENPAHIHTGTAPRGALVLYEPAPANDGLGHIALSLGNGRVISGNYTTTNGEILAVEHPQDNHLFYYKEKRSKRLNSFCWIWPYGYDTSTVGTTVVVPTAVTIQNNCE